MTIGKKRKVKMVVQQRQGVEDIKQYEVQSRDQGEAREVLRDKI